MMHISLEKNVTISKPVNDMKTAMVTLRYKDLTEAVKDENEIEVCYCFGDTKRRINLLNKLGFRLKETVFYNDQAPHGAIQQVWTRAS